MITINLFQPGKLNVYIQFPTGWDELLPEEVIEICRQQLLLSNSPAAAKAAILHFIIHTRAKLQKTKLPSGWVNLMDAEQAVMEAYPLLEFLYLENKLNQAPEESIKLPGFTSPTVYGPLPGFEDLTCGEFEDTEVFFNQFSDEPDGETLAKLAAVLWRPIKRKQRVPYIKLSQAKVETYKAERMVKHFLKIQPWRLYAIFVWYVGCRNRLPLIFPTVHENHGTTKDEPDILAFTKCIHAGAGPKNGNRNEIRITKLFEFMYDMEQEAIKAKELKQQYEQQQ